METQGRKETSGPSGEPFKHEVNSSEEALNPPEEPDDMMELVDLLHGLAADDSEAREKALALAEELIRNDAEDWVNDGAGDTGDGRKEDEEEIEYKFVNDLSQDELNERKRTRKERKVKSDIYRTGTFVAVRMTMKRLSGVIQR